MYICILSIQFYTYVYTLMSLRCFSQRVPKTSRFWGFLAGDPIRGFTLSSSKHLSTSLTKNSKKYNAIKIEWDLTNGPLSKLLELLDTGWGVRSVGPVGNFLEQWFHISCIFVWPCFVPVDSVINWMPSSSSGEHLLLPSLSTSFTNSYNWSMNLRLLFITLMLREYGNTFHGFAWYARYACFCWSLVTFHKEFFKSIFTSKLSLWQNVVKAEPLRWLDADFVTFDFCGFYQVKVFRIAGKGPI